MIKTILKNLTTFDKVVLIVITLVMANNVEHLAYVHYSIARHSLGNHILNTLHSVVVVLIVELSIIVMVFKGQSFYAGLYTLFLLVLSLIYYPLDQYWQNKQYGFFIAACIYSCMFTLSIWYFSKMAARRQQNAAEQQQFEAKYCEAARELSKAQGVINKLQHEIGLQHGDASKIAAIEMESARKVQQLEKELKELRLFKQQVVAACTCKYCNQQFESEASKRSHEGRCDKKENRKAA